MKIKLLLFFVFVFSFSYSQSSKRAKAYYAEGIKFYNLNYINDAINYFSKAIELDDKNPAFYYALAKSYYDLEDFQLAEYYISKAVSLNDTNLWFWRLYAVVLNKNAKFKEASKIYEKHIIPFSFSYSDYYNLIFLYDTLKRYKSALNVLKRLREFEGITYANFNLAIDIYAKILDTNSILVEYENLIENYPYSVESYVNYSVQLVILKKFKKLDSLLVYSNLKNLSGDYFCLFKFIYFLSQVEADSSFFYLKRIENKAGLNKNILSSLYPFILKQLDNDVFIQKIDSFYFQLKKFPNFYLNYDNFLLLLLKSYKYYLIYDLSELTLKNVYNQYVLMNYFTFSLFFAKTDKLKNFVDSSLIYYPNSAMLNFIMAFYYLKNNQLQRGNYFLNYGKNLTVNGYDLVGLFSDFLTLVYKSKIKSDYSSEFEAFNKKLTTQQSLVSYFAFLSAYLNLPELISKDLVKIVSQKENFSTLEFFLFGFYLYKINDLDYAKKLIEDGLKVTNGNDFLLDELAYLIYKKIGDSTNAEKYLKLSKKLDNELVIINNLGL